MQYIWMTAATLAVVFGLCFLTATMIRRKMKKKLPMPLHVLISIGSGIAVTVVVAAVYLNIHYASQDEAIAAFSAIDGPQVTETNSAYFIDGDGLDTAIVFYPGAKVDAQAYFPLMHALAERGVDCFLMKPPFRLSLFNINAALQLQEDYHYTHWIVSGHSMGGMAAAFFACDHPEAADGVVMLAAYPTKPLADNTPLLLVYGTEDKVLNRSEYENAKINYPSQVEEQIIAGGNHAYFGNYGEQSGDGMATISQKEQQEQTVDMIISYIEKYIR